MREKATESLNKLRKMLPPKAKHVPANQIDEQTWTRVSLGDMGITFDHYIKCLQWLKGRTEGCYSRTVSSIWFESEKDAFLFQLRWGGAPALQTGIDNHRVRC